ncbi:MAG: type IV pilin protein [Burkholderiaceae bacterium]|nr:type IV pilin protein [Burkholderiaceae bacterium]
MNHRTARRQGFTLLELMITVAVIAILAGVAYPSYTSFVAKGRRADAKQALLDIAQRMERRYTERATYAGATLGTDGLYANVSQGGYYSLAIATATADGFTLTATPRGAQAGDACGTYRYNQLGEQSLGSDASMSVAKCW